MQNKVLVYFTKALPVNLFLSSWQQVFGLIYMVIEYRRSKIPFSFFLKNCFALFSLILYSHKYQKDNKIFFQKLDNTFNDAFNHICNKMLNLSCWVLLIFLFNYKIRKAKLRRNYIDCKTSRIAKQTHQNYH